MITIPKYLAICIWTILVVNGALTRSRLDTKPSLNICGIFKSDSTLYQITKLALQDIRENEHILQGYNLNLCPFFMNKRENRGQAIKTFIDCVYTPPQKHILIAPMYSYEAEPVVELANNYWKLFAIGSTQTSSVFYDRFLYPYFVRTIPASGAYNPTRLSLLKWFNWQKVGIIYVDEGLHSKTAELMRESLLENNFTVKIESFVDDPRYAITSLLQSDYRIIIGIMWNSDKRNMMCYVHQLHEFSSNRIWIFEEQRMFWEKGSKDCSPKDILSASARMFTLTVESSAPAETIIETGETAGYIKARNANITGRNWIYSSYTYDAMLAVALALNLTITKLALENLTLEDYRYGDENMTRLISESMSELFITGLSGPMKFQNGERLGRVFILQEQDGQFVKLGTFNNMDESMNWNEDTSVRWKGGRKPSDSRIRIVLHLKVPVSIVIGVSVVAFVGMTMASLLLLFNILKQEHKIIKMSSPRLNNLILTGCIIVYLSVILFGLDGMVSSHQLAVLCQCRLWILSLGFSISFGSIFSKTWRVHVLLTNKKIQRKIIKDSQLFALVGIILGMDLILLTTWISVDPLKLKMLKFLPEMDEYDDTVTYPEVHICKSESLYWMPSLYGLKGLLLLFGVFLAWETRNVQIPALNDSRNIGLCVYNVFTMSAVGVIISMLIPRDSVVALYLVPCICIILSTTGTLLIIFLPKVIDVLKGHHIGRVSVMPTTNATSGSLDIGTASVPRCMGTCPEGMKLRELLREKQKEVGEKKGHI